MQPLTATVELPSGTVTVRELTVAEIRAWLADIAKGDLDLVDASLLEEISIPDLGRMTGLAAAELDALTPSQLRLIEAKAREVNGDFFGMRERLAKLGHAVAMPGQPDWPAPSAP